ncbi:MAG TPA: cupredoxin domain-containing protein [Chloroflexota bacterium]|nr:cupredoxin domain-containing protein [Chloroflexota bacterium]
MAVRRVAPLTLIAAASLILLACGGAASESDSTTDNSTARAQNAATGSKAASADQSIAISTGDYFFSPSEVAVRPGTISVTISNDGPRRHTFYVRNVADTDDIVSTDRLVAGGTETVTFTLPTEGRYRIYCAIPGHADRGEIGWFVATSATS